MSAAETENGGGAAPEARPEAETPSPPGGRTGRSVPAGAAAVICVGLFALVIIVGLRVGSERRDAAECRRRMELLGKAAEEYADGHKGFYPYGGRALEELLLKSLRHRKMLVCPKGKRTYRWTSRRRHRGDPAHRPLCWEQPETPAHGILGGYYHVLFVGGVVRELSPEKLDELLAAEKSERPTPPVRPRGPRPGLRQPPEARPPGSLRHVPRGTRMTPDPHEEDESRGAAGGGQSRTEKKTGSNDN
ncbi:MAG: hypothetical protein ACYTGB_09450 [Planctomycetota bacterium]